MDLKGGHPYWLLRSGLLHELPPLGRDISVQVVVVGAGVTGALVAHALCEAGVQVAVLDKRAVATGSTAASTALVQYELDASLAELISKHGEAQGARVYRRCAEAVDQLQWIVQRLNLDCDFTETRSLYLASNRAGAQQVQQEFALRRSYGFDVHLLSMQRLREQFGIHRRAALLTPKAATLDPYRLTHGLLNHHRQHTGLTVYPKTEVEHIKRAKRGIKITTANGYVVRADKVVMATGYEAAPFLHAAGVQLSSTYALVTDPLPEALRTVIDYQLWETARPYFYLRPTHDGRLMMGGEDEPFVNPKKRDGLLRKKAKRLMERFTKLYPDLPIAVDYFWTGTFASTQDGLPYIGVHPHQRDIYYALGYGGNGIVFAQVAACLITDLYLKRPTPDARLFSFER